MKLLLDSAFESLPKEHRTKGTRLPIRIDLRDLATWLARGNPFAGDAAIPSTDGARRSLETFVAALIAHQSGGFEFSVSDLTAVAKLSSLLIVLDGLDEVAEVKARTELIAEVTAALSRLSETCHGMQAIITSRPSVLQSTHPFPEEAYAYFRLARLSKEHILQYCDKWLAARRMPPGDAAAVRRLLRERIEQPHIKELARNSMQLAILLTMIYLKGTSLPDKRTALYHGYVDLFFNREAEKSSTVRENRDLLLQLHQFLAWTLHSEAERGRHAGSLTTDRLTELVAGYLRSEKREPEMVDRLVSGTVDRIVFLVSRVEGTFEFEVQPLREYFAAQYLYETAPYSPPGTPVPGTKPDRFDAMVKNPYWLNAVRFFSGFYSKGELASLAQRLRHMAETEPFVFLTYPRKLAVLLLGDWVFSQDQRATRDVVDVVLSGPLLSPTLNRQRNPDGAWDDDELALSEGCGRQEIVAAAWKLIYDRPKADLLADACEVVAENDDPADIAAKWKSLKATWRQPSLAYWLRAGVLLRALPKLTEAEIGEVLQGEVVSGEELFLLIEAGHGASVANNATWSEVGATHAISAYVKAPGKGGGVLGALANALSPEVYMSALASRSPVPAIQTTGYRSSRDWKGAIELPSVLLSRCDPLHRCAAFVREVREVWDIRSDQWANTLDPWNQIVNRGIELFGLCPAIARLACWSGAITSSTHRGGDAAELMEAARPLCERVRFARFRAGVDNWWEKQLSSVKSAEERFLFAVVAGCWASPMALARLQKKVGPLLDALSDDEFDLVARTVSDRVAITGVQKVIDPQVRWKGNLRVMALVAIRVDDMSAREVFRQTLASYTGGDRVLLAVCECLAAKDCLADGGGDWRGLCLRMRRAYERNAPDLFDKWVAQAVRRGMPLEIAKDVMRQRNLYPRFMTFAAEMRISASVELGREPVRTIANRDHWFKPPRAIAR
jgi:hypothetical protein